MTEDEPSAPAKHSAQTGAAETNSAEASTLEQNAAQGPRGERPRTRPSYGLPSPAAPRTDAASHRPSYGLPGPQPAAPQPAAPGSAAPGSTGSPSGASGSMGSPPPGSRTSGSPAPHPFAPGPAAAGSPASGSVAAAPRRRGTRLLLAGIACLILSVVVLIAGLAWGLTSVAGAVGDGPTAMSHGEATIQARSGQVVILYTPADQADTQCTVSGTGPGTVRTVPTSGTVPMGPGGVRYTQRLGVVATADTAVVVRCTAPAAGGHEPAYIGPISPWPLLLGVIGGILGGTVLGLTGLGLGIAGLVRRARSRRR